MASYGHTKDNVTCYGNPAAASKEVYMKWVGQSLRAVDAKVINDSWRMSSAAYEWSWVHLPSYAWVRVMSFLGVYEESETNDTEQIWHLRYSRMLCTAWRSYAFPVKKTRKKALLELPVVATSTPTKRRRGRSAKVTDSGEDTETDEEAKEGAEGGWVSESDSSCDKENQPPPEQQLTERELVREARYQQLQGKLSASGSLRVLDKRVTSGLWAGREALQALYYV